MESGTAADVTHAHIPCHTPRHVAVEFAAARHPAIMISLAAYCLLS